jgi:serine/threonine-protein kinase
MLMKRALGFLGTVLATSLVAACGANKAATGSGSGGSGAGATSAGPSTSAGVGGGSTASSSTGAGASSTTGGSTSASSGTSSSGAATCAGFNVVGGVFQAAEPWNTPVDADPTDPQSTTVINALVASGGWGNGNKLQIDFSINILCADATTPLMPFVLSQGSCSPDCDDVSTFPVPPGGAVEGETGYACNGGGDCHLLVVDEATNKLWEMWQAFDPPSTTTFNGTGAFIWDLTKAYPPNLRGDGCTSADAGGFPIAAMLFTADEVKAGHIDHAIRFILPNASIRGGNVYVHPGTHTTTATSGNKASAPPYGVHFRLKSSFDVTTLPTAGDQVVAKAMQKYGMFLADGGNIALTAANDQFTTAKWTDADVNVGPHDFYSITVSDFEVVDMGTVITTGDNCVRNP